MSRSQLTLIVIALAFVLGALTWGGVQHQRAAQSERRALDHIARSDMHREDAKRDSAQAASLRIRAEALQARLDSTEARSVAAAERYALLLRDYRFARRGAEMSGEDPAASPRVGSACDAALGACDELAAALASQVDAQRSSALIAQSEADAWRSSFVARSREADELRGAVEEYERALRLSRPRVWGLSAGLVGVGVRVGERAVLSAGPRVTLRYHDASLSAAYLVRTDGTLTPSASVSVTLWRL